MIVIEGLDNTGKTTLQQQLLEDYKSLRGRPSIGNKHDLDQIALQAEAEAYTLSPLMLSDRSRLISEFVYNPVLNARPLAYPYKTWLTYVAEFTSKPHLVVYCVRNLQHIKDSFSTRDQLIGVRTNLDELDARYDHMMGMFEFLFNLQNLQPRGHVVMYDFERVPYTHVTVAVRRYLQEVVE